MLNIDSMHRDPQPSKVRNTLRNLLPSLYCSFLCKPWVWRPPSPPQCQLNKRKSIAPSFGFTWQPGSRRTGELGYILYLLQCLCFFSAAVAQGREEICPFKLPHFVLVKRSHLFRLRSIAADMFVSRCNCITSFSNIYILFFCCILRTCPINQFSSCISNVSVTFEKELARSLGGSLLSFFFWLSTQHCRRKKTEQRNVKWRVFSTC